jgi:thiol-disulfide isomerase/thioredoxin
MNRRHILAFTAGLAFAAGGDVNAAPVNFAMNETPKPMPELQFNDSEGKALTLADFKGKVVLLNIWATWCGPCRKEMPTLDRLQASLGGSDFVVLPVSIDRKGMDVVSKFYAEIGIRHLSRYVAPTANQVLDTLGVWGCLQPYSSTPEAANSAGSTAPPNGIRQI